MIEKEFTQTEKGIQVQLKGQDVKKESFEAMAQQCNSGECNCTCDSDIKEHVENVEVSGNNGDVTITLQGNGLALDKVADAMQSCDMEKIQ